jgi:hypothetical protein
MHGFYLQSGIHTFTSDEVHVLESCFIKTKGGVRGNVEAEFGAGTLGQSSENSYSPVWGKQNRKSHSQNSFGRGGCR